MGELARCYIELWNPANAETEIYELYADMAVGHLAEYFCENLTVTPQGDSAMKLAGDALRSIAELYGERGQAAKREAV